MKYPPGTLAYTKDKSCLGLSLRGDVNESYVYYRIIDSLKYTFSKWFRPTDSNVIKYEA